ncbi:MAG: hypothetical protein KDE31_23945 [Caldilineaceae bacterium]|nr:hypothetical protein [Caldilineaceae bacterium]
MIANTKPNAWGGLAFAIGNVLFFLNKVDEMSRLFLGRWMPDLISGRDFGLILLGQVALILGYVAYYRFYTPYLGRVEKNALRLFSGGGIVMALGHGSFLTVPVEYRSYTEPLFLLVLIGMFCLLGGLLWFGVLNLRRSIVGRWRWLPLVTGLMGFVGFILFAGEEITAIFLFFRTLFALGLIGLGTILCLEKSRQPELVLQKTVPSLRS